MATDGLNEEAIGKVSLSSDEGLVGLVASRAEPINLEEASAHPRFSFHPNTNEQSCSLFFRISNHTSKKGSWCSGCAR